MQYRNKQHWEMDFEKRLNEYRASNEQGFPVSIKIGVYNGCFHNEHSPSAYEEIYNYIESNSLDCGFEEHESGPEVLAWIAIGTAGITLAKSVIDFVTAIINARAKGRKKGDRADGNIRLTVRVYGNKGNLKEETILEIRDCDVVTSEVIEKSITDVLNTKYKNK
ncbi:MAG: hypothetical protein RSD32_07270 [Oscillospiraceae bacterium]